MISVDLIPGSLVRLLQRRLLAWGRDNFADFPWRHGGNLFHGLVAEILLQRTRAEQVVPVYREFVRRFPHPVTLAEADASQVESVIAPLGLMWRARLLPELGRKLAEIQPEMLADMRFLLDVPGVGPYAAAAFLSLHAGRRASIVDANIVRFYGRFFGFDTGPETRRSRAILQLAERVTPDKQYRDFNYALIDFTRAICRPKPHHDLCPVADRCSMSRLSTGPRVGIRGHRNEDQNCNRGRDYLTFDTGWAFWAAECEIPEAAM